VLIATLGGVAVCTSAARAGAAILLGAGKSQGPLFHDSYVLQPTNPRAARRRILSSADRVRIASILRGPAGTKAF